nr:hypothetical protein [Nostoc sp. KVJ20]
MKGRIALKDATETKFRQLSYLVGHWCPSPVEGSPSLLDPSLIRRHSSLRDW